MSANRINKEDVYNFLDERQSKVMSEKVGPLEEEIRIMRGKIVSDILSELGGLENVANKFKEIHGIALEISDGLSFTYGNLNEILRSAGRLSNPETLEIHIMNSISDTVKIKQKKTYLESVQNEIRNEFRKLRQMVKSCSTGNQAVRNLKEIGFDVSSIKTVKKQELVALNMNNDLLGLPEVKNGEQ